MPFASPAQQRWAHAEAARGNESVARFAAHGDTYMREAKKKGVSQYNRNRDAKISKALINQQSMQMAAAYQAGKKKAAKDAASAQVSKVQPRYGNGTSGRRILEDVEKGRFTEGAAAVGRKARYKASDAATSVKYDLKHPREQGQVYWSRTKGRFGKADEEFGKAGKARAGDFFVPESWKWPQTRTKAAVAGGVAGGAVAGGAGYAVGRKHGKMLEKRKHTPPGKLFEDKGYSFAVGKARNYDPEHARQRRLGMTELGLLGGGGLLAFRGVKGMRATTRLVRGKHPNVVGSAKEVEELTRRTRGAISGTKGDIAQLGGGALAIGGAGAVHQHATSRRGRAYL